MLSPNKKLVACKLCGQEFEIFKSMKNKFCKDCLSKEYTNTCLHCGIKFTRNKKTPLDVFMKKDYCSAKCCYDNNKRPSILSSIFFNLITCDNHVAGENGKTFQNPKIKECDLPEIIMENCAYFRLYQLYSYLEPYYNDHVALQNRLLNTQAYLIDILRRIKNLNELLRINPKRFLIGYYRDKRCDIGNWETGPTDREMGL